MICIIELHWEKTCLCCCLTGPYLLQKTRCIIWDGVLDWNHGVELWSGVRFWNVLSTVVLLWLQATDWYDKSKDLGIVYFTQQRFRLPLSSTRTDQSLQNLTQLHSMNLLQNSTL